MCQEVHQGLILLTVREEIEDKCQHTVNYSNRLLCLFILRGFLWMFHSFLNARHDKGGEQESRVSKRDGREERSCSVDVLLLSDS